ncbi:MAG: hypothetical protein JO116_10925 [Planctomycetaceae bacterium]|nr:hypothetical protein [Planctomycetaceae bacterium]
MSPTYSSPELRRSWEEPPSAAPRRNNPAKRLATATASDRWSLHALYKKFMIKTIMKTNFINR